MAINRRRFLKLTGATLAGTSSIGAPRITRAATKVRVGYPHALPADAHIWVGVDNGTFAKHGIDLEPVQFNSGVDLFQAMIGGSVEMASTGPVISQFGARGQCTVFLLNCIELNTVSIWAREDMGVKSFADLKGKKIATTVGTSAHIVLETALRANRIDSKDVEVINQAMPNAVASFISGAVPAISLWVPFNIAVRDKVPGAKLLASASAFHPDTVFADGWACAPDFYKKNRALCASVIRGWADANDRLVRNPDAELEAMQKRRYQTVPLGDLKEIYKSVRMSPSVDWRASYADGTITQILQRTSDYYVRVASIPNPLPATQYFDPTLYLETVKG
jgi:NitT/TauT family transport system substrate-binding protein